FGFASVSLVLLVFSVSFCITLSLLVYGQC
ncbi:MAG: hypothetical protein ACI8O8_000428, partial [Oleiphilaceae bacterium]